MLPDNQDDWNYLIIAIPFVIFTSHWIVHFIYNLIKKHSN